MRILTFFFIFLSHIILTFGEGKGDGISLFYPGGQYLLLTFSGGPHFKNTHQILDILKRYKMKATFFVDINRSMNHQEVLRRIVQEGHDIGIQGSSTVFRQQNANTVFKYVISSIDYLKQATSLNTIKYFRPPSQYQRVDKVAWKEILAPLGNDSSSSVEASKLKTILWTIHTRDLETDIAKKEGKVEQSSTDLWVEGIVKQVKPGVIILCHDHSETMLRALPQLLEQLIHKHYYELLSVTQVLSFPDDTPH